MRCLRALTEVGDVETGTLLHHWTGTRRLNYLRTFNIGFGNAALHQWNCNRNLYGVYTHAGAQTFLHRQHPTQHDKFFSLKQGLKRLLSTPRLNRRGKEASIGLQSTRSSNRIILSKSRRLASYRRANDHGRVIHRKCAFPFTGPARGCVGGPIATG